MLLALLAPCGSKGVLLSRPYSPIRRSFAKSLRAARFCAILRAVYEIYGLEAVLKVLLLLRPGQMGLKNCFCRLNSATITSHLTPHTSHLTPHTSHLTPHASRLTPHKSSFSSSISRASATDRLLRPLLRNLEFLQ